MKKRELLPLTSSEIMSVPSLEVLATLDRKTLLTLFQQLHSRPAPRHSSRRFLEGHCAWGIQAVQMGRNPMYLREELIRKLDAKFGKGSEAPLKRYKLGTRLIREWQGVVYEVVITEQGFLWNDTLYKSLSPIATEITGVRWSGPRFFGISSTPKINGRRKERLQKEGIENEEQ